MRKTIEICMSLFLLCATPCFAWRVPEMAVGRAASAIKVDGELDEPAWQSAACVPVFVDWITGQPMAVQTRAWACWDERALTVAFDCLEPKMDKIVAKIMTRDGTLWGEDAVEVFLRPRGKPDYFHFILNSLGTLYDAMGQGAEYTSHATSAAHRHADRWTVEIRIPWQDIGGPPKPGDVWRMNFNRGRKVAGDELSGWAATGGSFHNVSRFGRVRFVRRTPAVFRLDLGGRRLGANRAVVSGFLPSGAQQVRVVLRGVGDSFERRAENKNGKWRLDATYPLLLNGDESILLELVSAGRVFYRQAIRTATRVGEEVHAARAAASRLRRQATEGARFRADVRAEFRRRAELGERLLVQADALVKAAVKAGQNVSRDVWSKVEDGLVRFNRGNAKPALWSHNPLAESTPSMMPTPNASLPRLRLTALVNERESASLLITNIYGGQLLELRVSITPLRAVTYPGPGGGASGELYREHLELAEAVMTRSSSRGVIGDPIAPLDGAGRIFVPAGQTRELWLTVDTHDAKPGLYHGVLKLAPTDPKSPVPKMSVPVELRVWPIHLPDKMPIRVFNWDYGAGAKSDATLADLLEHRVNVFAIVVPRPEADGSADFTVMDPWLKRVHPHGLVFFETWFFRRGWKPHFAKWLRSLVAYMKSRGLGYQDWVIHIFDETLSDLFLATAKDLKKVDPKVQIFSDKMGTPDRLKLFAPYVNFWCPHHGELGAEGMKTMRDSGLPIWTYECGSGKAVSPAKNRSLPWRAWRYRLDGVGFWTYNSAFGDPWDDFDQGKPDWAKVYPGPTGRPVPSKRWEAWREGLEDFLLLRVYQEELHKRAEPTQSDNALLQQARRVGDMGQAPLELMDKLARVIIQRILELRGQKLKNPFPQQPFNGWERRVFGDRKGTVRTVAGGRDGRLALQIRNATSRSWTFVVRRLSAKPGDRVRFSFWAKGNARLRACVSEGFRFGGDPRGHRISGKTTSLTNQWQRIVIEHEVREEPVEAVVGLDYGCGGQQAAVCQGDVARVR